MEIEDLVGLKVKTAFISDDRTIAVLQLEDKKLFLSWVGDCCASCYLAHIEGSENLIDATVLEVRDPDWVKVSKVSEDEENYETVESMGTIIKTTKGYVTLETRVEHNGFYGGRIRVASEGALDQYDGMISPKDYSLKPLEDF